jgi:hypothetical protein
MAEWVSDFVNINKREVRWYLQKFIARRREETAMLDERFCKENLKEGMRQTPEDVLIKLRDVIIKYFPRCEIR